MTLTGIKIKYIFVFVALSLSAIANAQIISWDSIVPSATDPGINSYNGRHYMVRSDVDTMHTLVIFIPGTYRYPKDYLFMMEQFARLGYHVIGLSYKFDPAVNPICRPTNDIFCHYNARMETIDGLDRHPAVSVNPANSISNRLQKLLNSLTLNKPEQGWGQFYSDGQIKWNNIIISGHSQGASLAGIMGKEYLAKRVVMFSVIDFLDSGSIPSWISNTTNHENYYAFIHTKDELVPFYRAQIGWDKLGMTEFGAMESIDCNTAPYKNTHLLYTNYLPSTLLGDKYHNGTCLDIYIQEETDYKTSLTAAIKYLFRK